MNKAKTQFKAIDPNPTLNLLAKNRLVWQVILYRLRRLTAKLVRLSAKTAPTQMRRFKPSASVSWQKTMRLDPTATSIWQTTPLVSIILPTHNRIALLPNALNSILQQSYPHWELLIIDDGSTDGSIDMIKRRFQDPRIHIIINQGQGVCAARNSGLTAAQGDTIAYLDSDNTWTPQYLEFMLYTLAYNQSDSAYAALRCLNPHAARLKKRDFILAKHFDYAALQQDNYIDLNVFMHKKRLFD